MIAQIFTARTSLIVAVILAIAGVDARADDPLPVRRAHAHNDYLHQRPLLDALEQGFGSAEADVFLVDGELLVGHTRFELSADRTLRSLYLQPLQDRIGKNKGSVYGDGQPIILLIDIKSDAAATYQTLDRQLAEFREIFARVEGGRVTHGPVLAIVSGNRAADLIAADPTRYVGIDGRLTDLDSDQPEHLLPLISDNWQRHFQWRGEGPMPRSDQEKLQRVIKQAHAKRRRVRFWATPDRPAVWAALDDAGADLINTDDLIGLSTFLRSRR
jgi:hypothetical protein